jgi:membrane-associated PAP2 superfamily phosphatase
MPLVKPGQALALALLAALLALLAWDALGLDAVTTAWVGDELGFVWQHHWLTAGVLHQGGRGASAAALLMWIVGLRWPVGPWRTTTVAERAVGLALCLLCLLLVPFIKARSGVPCPWDLMAYGGMYGEVSHWRGWQWRPQSVGCFPSGHAAAGFAFWPLALMLHRRAPRAARHTALIVLAAGFALGATQWVRGAHHLSHVGWTAWLCVTLCSGAWWARACSHYGMGSRCGSERPQARRKPQPG